jgi:transcription termination/antitermination protein NusA
MFFWLRKAAKPVQAGVPADRAEDALTSRCRELGVEAALSEIAGISPPLLIALGENGIKTVENLAGCDSDDLHGWVEQTSGTTTRHAGVLDGFALSRDECGAIIMKARTRVGWIDESRPAQPAKAR